MKVPFYDLKLENQRFKRKILSSFNLSFEKSWFILGNNVELFEKEWAKYLDAKHAIGVANGTDALILALRGLGIKAGDEVIVPAYTFVATAFAVSVLGARPVFVDVDRKTHLIDTNQIERKITRKTKAIIPVHLYGNVAEMDTILSMARKHKLYVVEDAAQAHGAEYKKRKAGTIGDIGCFSFYPAKNLGALGDGGAVVTNKKQYFNSLVGLRNYGQSKKYYSDHIGYNSRLDEIQAGFLSVKLNTLEKDNKKRRKLAAHYRKLLSPLGVEFPLENDGILPVHHLFTIQLRNRNQVMTRLSEKGVQTLIHYPVPVHLQKAYKELGYKEGEFPVSEEIARTTMSLPFYPSMTLSQVKYVVEMLKKVI